MRPVPDDLDEDPRILQAARAYLAELEAGRKPDRQALYARHPGLTVALAECFDGIDLAQSLRLTVSPPVTDYPANPLGDFQILHELGRGGMGVVYEAVQLSLGRRVALKVLPFAAGLDAKQLQRFKTEAHAAAQLHHTNIVPVYAVGCERGLHFYAMQLIGGRSLDTVIRELRETTSPAPVAGNLGGTTVDHPPCPTVAGERRDQPGSSLRGSSQLSISSRERFRTAARLIAQVADALEYAHDAGVIHRDIKPANLLLDDRGIIWVTDFGLAQVSADVSLTQTGNLVGTLRYMSPEQAAGRRVLVDHRTDVYSLGATLYELLTLEPIFPGSDRQALLHQILNEEPRPPRQVDRSIPVELETIVLKAVAKSPGDRYATAGDMAADLRRYLEERPILARRASLLDRARKWVRRHPTAVGAAVILLVLGLVGLAACTALIAREQARTQAAYDQERARAREAEERFRLARRSVDDMIQLAEEELADKPHVDGLRKRLLEAALVYYQEFIEQRRDNPDAQAELEVTSNRVKQILADLAVLQGAGQLFLLEHPAVLDDLQLSPEQRGRITELSSSLAEQRMLSFRNFHQLNTEERRQRFLELARSNEAAVTAILTPEQRRRFRQIALQTQGFLAFREPEVVATLKLTADQRERLRAVEGDSFFGRSPERNRMGPPPGESPERGRPGQLPGDQPRKPNDQWLRAAMERALAILTDEQRKRWGELTGEPFAGPLLFLRPGPPRGFGPPGPP